jgi:starch phosphorylase
MKLALNGALTIGTLDGANIEIREEVGAENFFLFGLTTDEVTALRQQGYDPLSFYQGNAELRQSLDMIASGYFCPDEPGRYQDVADSLLKHGDHFLLLADYASYVACQDKVDELYRDPQEWTKRAILNVAGMGRFSSDRTIREYAERIWQVTPINLQSVPDKQNA